MKELGELKHFLGLKVEKIKEGIFCANISMQKIF